MEQEATPHGLVSKDSTGPRTAEQPFSVTRLIALERDGNRCTWDGCNATERLHVHHIKPRRQGGGHEVENLRTLCASHHAKEHMRMFDEGAAGHLAASMSEWTRDTIAALDTVSDAARDLFNEISSAHIPGRTAIEVAIQLHPGEHAAWGELVDAGVVRGPGRYAAAGWIVPGVRV